MRKRKCKGCGETFLPKTESNVFCTPRCSNRYFSRRFYQSHREKCLEDRRAYRKTAKGAEYHRTFQRRYRQAHPRRRRANSAEAMRLYYQRHREERLEQSRRYYKEHAEKLRAKAREYSRRYYQEHADEIREKNRLRRKRRLA
jgi:hypothetical protein